MLHPERSPWRTSRTAGFTLVELLVAITLLGLLSLALAGGLRFGSRAWERVETESRDLEDLMIARAFLADRLERSVLPLEDEPEGQAPIGFQGSASALRFVSTMPGHLQARGFYRIMIGLEGADSGNNLMLAWTPMVAADAGLGGRRVLLAGVQSIQVSYYRKDEDAKQGRWQDSWQDPEGLPDLVRIAVAFAGDDTRAWPPLVVAPRITSLE